MSSDPDSERRAGPEQAPDLPDPSAGLESVESYRTEDGVVLYDAENPLAWLKATRTVSVDDHV